MELKLPKIDLGILKQKKKPLHVAVDCSNLDNWSGVKKDDEDCKEVIAKRNVEQIKTFMNYQIKTEIPVFTLNLASKYKEDIKELTYFFKDLINNELIHKNKTRVFIIGNWFDLNPDLTDAFKKVMEDTKDYDTYFLNLCINYDGQEEILGVIKLLATKAKLGKLDLADLNKQMVKQNLYSSYFTPPEIIVEPSKTYSGILLWDAKDAKIFQTRTHWLDFKPSDIDAAIDWANRE